MHKIILRAGALETGVAPAVGAGITHFSAHIEGHTFHLLRPAPDSFEEVRRSACFPLVPFSNRVREGAFEFQQQRVQLPPNMPGQKHPMHGIGWRRSWQLTTHDDTHAELVLRHEASEWPWSFEARQRIDLDEHGLTLSLSVRNLSQHPMPAGLGFHPYFLCDEHTTLDARTRRVWLTDDELMPTQRQRVNGRYLLRNRPMLEQTLDNGYEGWSGHAIIDWGPIALRMSAPSTHFFQCFSPRPNAGIYAPEGWGVFAAEPVTHANAALNRPTSEWSAAGLRILQQDQQTGLSARFEILG
jgi:aldose 1-epimerase